MEKVACNLHLVCKMVPQLEHEVDVCGAEATDEVFFESLDGLFCGADSVIVGLDKLNGAVVGGDKYFDGGHSLIVGDVEGGHKSFCGEGIKYCGEGCNDVVTLC